MLDINKIYCMDCLDGLNQLDPKSVNCCVTSPPYFGLRDYHLPPTHWPEVYYSPMAGYRLPEIHIKKWDGCLGLEPTIDMYVGHIVTVFREVYRVLCNDGTLWLNLGDSYAGSGMGAANYPGKVSKKQLSNKGSTTAKGRAGATYGLNPKNLIGIPWRIAFALQADGWYLRQDIIWGKNNPMPESVRDRCTKSHEYIFLMSKSLHYYYDAEAISEPATESTIKRLGQKNINNQTGSSRIPCKTNGNMKAVVPRYGGKKYTKNPEVFNRTKSGNIYDLRSKRNKRSIWMVSTQPFKGAHFATYPPKLVEPCILAGCPEGGIILDPFMGSGTTGMVALQMHRNFLGFELNPENIEIARKYRFNNILQKVA